MDKKPRILVVEDVDTFRESHIDNLERENYTVAGAGSLAEARETLEKRSYHAALVDIMLGGEKDLANRDGVKVLEVLRDLDEGTQPIVVSAQPEKQRVRDFLKDYGAFDYLDKRALASGGIQVLLQMVKSAVEASSAGKDLSWDELDVPLAAGMSERFFVTDCLSRLQFKGGFEHFSRSLLTVGKHLSPLLVPQGKERAMLFDATLKAFRGMFWSKGQGLAIELLIGGTQLEPDIRRTLPQSTSQLIYSREKAGLAILVLSNADAKPGDFVKPKPAPASPKSRLE